MDQPSYNRQLLGSLLVAALIVVAAVLVVTGQFGPTSAAELEQQEERLDLREERLKERQELREERLEELRDRE